MADMTEMQKRLEALDSFMRSEAFPIVMGMLEATEKELLANIVNPKEQEFLARNAGALDMVRRLKSRIPFEVEQLKTRARERNG